MQVFSVNDLWSYLACLPEKRRQMPLGKWHETSGITGHELTCKQRYRNCLKQRGHFATKRQTGIVAALQPPLLTPTRNKQNSLTLRLLPCLD